MITSAWRRPLTKILLDRVGTNRVSDQLSDYGLAAPRSRVHVHGPSSHSARDLDRAPDLLLRRRGRKSNSRCRVPGTCPKSTRQAVNEGQLRTPTSVTSKAIRRVAHRARCVFQAGHASSILVIALRPRRFATWVLRPPVRDRSSGPAEPLARTPRRLHLGRHADLAGPEHCVNCDPREGR